MTARKLVILLSAVLAVLFGMVIFAYVRINGHETQLAAQAEAIAEMQESLNTQKNEEVQEPEATPEPVVYVVSPVTAFDAYTVEAAPYFTLPEAESEPAGTLETGSNAVVSGICGDFYYVTLPDGTACYIPQQYLAQTATPTPEPTPEPVPEATPVPEVTSEPEADAESTAE